MEEKEKNESAAPEENKISGEVKIKLPVSEKLSNYWYHYKWHTIVALFVLVVAIVLTVNLCSREKYDIYILYAGDKAVSNSSSDGDVPERVKFLNSFGNVVSDFDGDGKVSVGFKSLYSPDAEELERLESEGKDTADSLRYNDSKTLDQLIAGSDYYLLFLDYAVFARLAENSNMIAPVDSYLDGWSGRVARVGNSSGVYLADTKFYEYEGIRDLPEDTVICIKYATAFASDKDEEKREEAIEVLKKILKM